MAMIYTVGHGARSAEELVSILTANFTEAVTSLTRRAERVCIMCAESDPANCHRLLIADWLVAHGHKVVHLLGEGRMREHALHLQEDLWRDV